MVHVNMLCLLCFEFLNSNIKTHGSESWGQEEAIKPTQQMSELFTCHTAVNFVNALNKPC